MYVGHLVDPEYKLPQNIYNNTLKLIYLHKLFHINSKIKQLIIFYKKIHDLKKNIIKTLKQ
jgi:hypothetical protein